MKIRTIVELTREEKSALIKAHEILCDLDRCEWEDDSPLGSVGDVIYDLSRIMTALSDEHDVNFFNLNE